MTNGDINLPSLLSSFLIVIVLCGALGITGAGERDFFFFFLEMEGGSLRDSWISVRDADALRSVGVGR